MKKFEQLKALYHTMNMIYSTPSDSKMYVSAITADFDRLFELSWKTLKAYLADSGYKAASTGSPRDIIKLAYRNNLVNNGDFWLKMLKDRNDDSHQYSESSARSYVSRIRRDYLPFIAKFIHDLSVLIPEEPDILVEVPESFLAAREESGLEYDEFLNRVMRENDLNSELEIFEEWERIKDHYLQNHVHDSESF